MLLSLPEAATILGKSERQIRYLIKLGKLTARKQEGRWVVDRDDLPLTDAQRRRLATSSRALVEHVQEVAERVADTKAKAGGRRFSVRDLRAFQAGIPLHRAAVAAVGEAAKATGHLRDALDALARGCHSFHARDKHDSYRSAREHAASAVAELLLHPSDDHSTLADRIEQELLPRITGLLRSTERGPSRRQSSRFDAFGSAPQ